MADDQIPESVREYFGHDKVAHHGSGGLPAAPPAPPGTPARRQAEEAVADALSKVRTPGPRAGSRPAVVPPAPPLPARMRMAGERAVMEASMRRLGGRAAPHPSAGPFWRLAFAPVYRRVPWSLKRRMVALTSGVKGWRT